MIPAILDAPLVLIDMDGVLVDLDQAMEDYWHAKGRTDLIFVRGKPNRVDEGGYFKALNKFSHDGGFLKAYPFPYSTIMWERIFAAYKRRTNFAICTSRGHYIPDSEIILKDKADWLAQFYTGTLAKISFICTSSGMDKALFARSSALLIDDMEKNLEYFKKCGGQTLLFDHTKTKEQDITDAIDLLLTRNK